MDMLFLQANAKLPPRGEVTSTARKGDKWSKQAKPGDVLDLKVTETGALIGRGAVILVEQQTFASVIRKAYQNHAAHKLLATEAEREAVKASLRAAYGDAKDEDVYTVVHFLVLNDYPDTPNIGLASTRELIDEIGARAKTDGTTGKPAIARYQDDTPMTPLPVYADGAATMKQHGLGNHAITVPQIAAAVLPKGVGDNNSCATGE